MRLLELPQGHTWPPLGDIDSSWLLMGTSETQGLDLGVGWINLSVPWTAPNYHLRNLELIVEQGHRPRGIVWLMPEPNRVTVFDHGDRVLHWGVPDSTPWTAQGQTPHWDQAIRLRRWAQSSHSMCGVNHWWTWSRLTNQLVGWPLIQDPQSPDFADRLRQELIKLR
jgi:hypothetical protein